MSLTDKPLDPLDNAALAQLQRNFEAALDRQVSRAMDGAEDAARAEALRGHMLAAGRSGATVDAPAAKQLALLTPKEIEAATAKLRQPLPAATRLTMQAAGALRDREARHDDFFGNRTRMYFPLDAGGAASDVEARVGAALSQHGYRITDYAAGKATDAAGKQEFKIGKLLGKHGFKDELSAFQNDSSRTLDRMLLCISRDPQDIARMSTGRGWESCMSLGGINFHKVKHDVQQGTLIGYLITDKDPELHNPLGRVLMKPHRDAEGNLAMVPGESYGLRNEAFERTMERLGQQMSGPAAAPGVYDLPKRLYPDAHIDRHLHVAPDATPESFFDALGVDWSRGVDGRLEIGDLELRNISLPQLPDLSGVRVRGNLTILQTNLRSLKGLPQEVGGHVDVSENRLTTLDGCPQSIGGDLRCDGNGLVSLKGAPAAVGGDFSAAGNDLTSLAGAPARIGGSYNVSHNALTSLEGAPAQVRGHFRADNNRLLDLRGGPESVSGGYDVADNRLTALVGAPAKVGGFFTCSCNNLTSLQHGPAEATAYDCSHNPLASLHGMPRELRGSMNCSGIWADDLQGAPEFVGGNLVADHSRIASLKGAPQTVGGYMTVIGSDLRSLEGAPRSVGGMFDVTGNRLESLQGGPRQVGDIYVCEHNALSDLRGLPNSVSEVHAKGNPLESYRGAVSFTAIIGDKGAMTPSRIPAALRDADQPAPTLPSRLQDAKWLANRTLQPLVDRFAGSQRSGHINTVRPGRPAGR